MSQMVLAFPVLEGKTGGDAELIAEELKSRPKEYEESRRRLGITMERAFLQETAMGDFVVAYIESARDFSEVSPRLAQSDLDIDHDFVRLVKEVHGVDMTQVPDAPPETLAAWFDPQVTQRGRGLAFCVPLLGETVAKARWYFPQAYASSEFAASRRALGTSAEVVTLLHTPQGPIGAAYVEGADPFESNRRFAASREPFDVSFKEQLRVLCPPFVDFGKPLEGIREIFDSATVASLATGEPGRKVA